MPKKVERTFKATIAKNTVKGGAWLCTIDLHEAGECIAAELTAWSNASAAKRHVKERVRSLTTRKSVPLTASGSDEKGKPTYLHGEITFKVAL